MLADERMRALVVRELCGPNGCQLSVVARPAADELHVVLNVEVAGVTFPDLLLTHGDYQLRPELPFVPGFEVAGTVRSAPQGSGFAAGQRAAGFVSTGGFAEQAAVTVAQTFPMPDDMSFEAAAALIVNYHTVYFALQGRGRLRPGETLLVHEGAGGVGSAAVQVGRALGARVLATASNEEDVRTAAEVGADEVIDSRTGWKEQVLTLTAGLGVDVLLDPAGRDPIDDDSVRCLAREGRLLIVGFAGGRTPTVRSNRLLLRDASVFDVAWGAFLEQVPEFMTQAHETLVRMATEGYVAPLIGARYPLARGAEALRDLAERPFGGKAVLTLD